MKTTLILATLSVVACSMFLVTPSVQATNGVGVCVSPVTGAEVTDLTGAPIPTGVIPDSVTNALPFVGVVVDGGSINSPGPIVDTSGSTPTVHPENALGTTYSPPAGWTTVTTDESNYQSSCCAALGQGYTMCFAPVGP